MARKTPVPVIEQSDLCARVTVGAIIGNRKERMRVTEVIRGRDAATTEFRGYTVVISQGRAWRKTKGEWTMRGSDVTSLYSEVR